jgi:hypothetical protein
MARETGGKASLADGFVSVSQNIQFSDIERSLEGFRVYLQAQIKNATENLAKSGVTKAREKVRSSTTDWGRARMSGSYFGVSFGAYGRSAGREDTGTMYDELSWSINSSTGGWEGTFGWDAAALSRAPYIPLQEQGFYSTGTFDKFRTEASGVAKFKKGPTKFIEGAQSIPFATESVARRAASNYSGARNAAIKLWRADGFKGDPGSYADVKPSGAQSIINTPF